MTILLCMPRWLGWIINDIGWVFGSILPIYFILFFWVKRDRYYITHDFEGDELMICTAENISH